MHTDTLSDLQAPNLLERLARYVGACELHARGLVTTDYRDKKLADLRLACRAGDAAFALLCDPSAPQGVAARVHAELTRRR